MLNYSLSFRPKPRHCEAPVYKREKIINARLNFMTKMGMNVLTSIRSFTKMEQMHCACIKF
jgi:hypothetical protein